MIPIDSQLPTSFEFKIGTLDLTFNVTSLRFKWPEISMGQPQSSTVEFSLKNKDFDALSYLNPELNQNFCRQAQICTLKVDGFLIFTGWLDRYKFDPKGVDGTPMATGTLIDAIALISFDRKSFELPDIEIGAGTPVGEAVRQLLVEASKDVNGNQVITSIATPELTGVFTAPVTSSDPVGDAQKYASADRVYMYATPTGGIAWAKYPNEGTPLFRKSLAELITFQQDPTADSFQASKLTVRGSHEEAIASEEEGDDGDDTERIYDDLQRLKKVITTTRKPRAWIQGQFPAELQFVDDSPFFPTVFERKIIEYFYVGDTKEIETTVTTKYQPYGYLQGKMPFPVVVTTGSFDLVPAEEITETKTKKSTRIPRGIIQDEFPVALQRSDTGNFTLALYDEEAVDNVDDPTAPTAAQYEKFSAYNNPPRDSNPPPEFPVTTVPVSGAASVTPVCTSPFLRRDMVMDVGYLYDQAQATALAGWLIVLQQHRHDSYLIEMPPPKEWLANPKPFCIFDAHDGRFIAEAPELVIDAGDGRCVWIVRGLKLGGIDPVPAPPEPIPYSPPSNALSLAPLPSFIFTVGIAIQPIQLQAFGGDPPYTWSASLPSGLTISVTGAITGTPTAVAASTSYSATVTDNASATATRNFNIEVRSLPVEQPNIGVNREVLFKRTRRLLVRSQTVPSNASLFKRLRKLIATTEAGSAPPSNDNFANAFDLGDVEASTVTSPNMTMRGSTIEPLEPIHLPLSKRSLWYKLDTLVGNNIELTISKLDPFSPREFNPRIFVYTGTAINALTSVSTTNPGAPIVPGEITVAFTSTTDIYYIAVTPDEFDLLPNPPNPMRLSATGSVNVPTDPVASYRLWYRNTSTDIIDSGGIISQWKDRSGNNAHLTQGTSSNRPTRISNGLNGRDTLRFDGSDDFLRTVQFFAGGGGAGFPFTARTFYFVLKQISWTNGDVLLSAIESGSGPTNQILQNGSAPILSSNGVINNSDLLIGAWAILTIVLDGANSLSQINQLAAVTGLASAWIISAGDYFQLCARSSPLNPGNFELAEIIIYPAAHNLSDRDLTQRYLAARHGISI